MQRLMRIAKKRLLFDFFIAPKKTTTYLKVVLDKDAKLDNIHVEQPQSPDSLRSLIL